MVFFFKQKTAYEMRISDWSSDVCSSDLLRRRIRRPARTRPARAAAGAAARRRARRRRIPRSARAAQRALVFAALGPGSARRPAAGAADRDRHQRAHRGARLAQVAAGKAAVHLADDRSEEPTSELQSLMRISYAV